MVVDNLENLMQYQNLHPRFPKAFAFLKELLEKGAEDGRHESGSDYYVNLMTGETKEANAATAESHRKYIDVQLVINGQEIMCIPSGETLPEITTDYQADGDYMLYAPISPSACHQLLVGAGQFAIFFTDELHAPMMAVDGKSATVRKAVLKVLA